MKVTIYKNESIFFKTWVAYFDIDFFYCKQCVIILSLFTNKGTIGYTDFVNYEILIGEII